MSDKPDPRDDLLQLNYQVDLGYSYAAGAYASKFMTALRDEGKFYGTRDTETGMVLVPPRPVSGISAAPTDEWVEVGPRGTVTGFTVVEVAFVDPMTGEERPIPYGFALIKLEGSDTNIYHFLEENRPEHLAVGMDVEAVLKAPEERVGNLADVIHFRSL